MSNVNYKSSAIRNSTFLESLLTYRSSIDDDYLQNASVILDKLKSYYRQGGESSNLSKVLQDYTQVRHYVKINEMIRAAINDYFNFCLMSYSLLS